MFIASIDDEFFKCETQEELDTEIREHCEYNLSVGESLEIVYYQPTVTKTVSLDFIWTVKGEEKKPVSAKKGATVEI